MTLYPKLITDALEKVIYPGTKKNIIESEMLADTPSINGNKVSFTLIFPRETDPFLKSTIKAAEAQIHYSVGKEVEVTITTEFKNAPRPEVGKLLPQVKNIIAVSSGKGGVGKSTLCILFANYLAAKGRDVCIIDTDLQKTILMQRRKDKLIYEGEEEPYNVQDFDVTDVETIAVVG